MTRQELIEKIKGVVAKHMRGHSAVNEIGLQKDLEAVVPENLALTPAPQEKVEKADDLLPHEAKKTNPKKEKMDDMDPLHKEDKK
jgi:hypothetical protein